MSNTRYTFAELLVAQAIGKFTTGKAVTIQVINAKTGVAETLTSNVCTEILTSGVFTWQFSNLQTVPAVFTQYLYIMTDNSPTPVERREMVDTGGWVELIAGSGSPIPADTCKITTTLFQPDGSCVIDPNDLYNREQNLDNYIAINDPYFANSRYFRIGQYQPSYDQLIGQAFWVMPQGATVDVKIDIIGVQQTGITVPNDVTIDLNALLNL